MAIVAPNVAPNPVFYGFFRAWLLENPGKMAIVAPHLAHNPVFYGVLRA